MGKKRGFLLAVLFVALAGGLVWVLSRPAEPAYQGKPLRAWLNDLHGWGGDTNNPAFIAFREMGTNAIPALLKIIESNDPPFQRMILKLNRRQSLVHFPRRQTWPQRRAASFALYAMGPNAKPAFSTLTNLLFYTNNLPPGAEPAIPLAGMGSEGLPPLIAALTNQNALIRESAATELAWERSDLNIVVPALIARLDDQYRGVHLAAVFTLGQLHAEPGLAVPALMKHFPGNGLDMRKLILRALAGFETNASTAVPMLVESLSDEDQEVRRDAASALKQIDPAAAAKAGVK
jgi:HEAT repeat protein